MQKESHNHQNEAYSKLMWMASLSFLLMYSMMYATFEGLIRNIGDNSTFFIALILTLPMIIIEVILLGGLNRSKAINIVVILLSMFVFIICYQVVSHRQAATNSFIEGE